MKIFERRDNGNITEEGKEEYSVCHNRNVVCSRFIYAKRQHAGKFGHYIFSKPCSADVGLYKRWTRTFFYYKDFGGVGYGSAFFYGHLTLYPFLPVLAIGGKIAFVYVYIAVIYVIAFTGVRQVASRFTNKATIRTYVLKIVDIWMYNAI